MFPQANDVAANLRRFRAERKMSLAAVAEEAGISVATLSRVETNKQSVDVNLLLTLARILGVTTAEVFGQPEDDGNADLRAVSRRLADLPLAEQARLFIAASQRNSSKDPTAAVDELLSTLDVLRDDLRDMRQMLRRKR